MHIWSLCIDAEVAAIPFIYRFNKALVHYRNFDPMKIIADQKWDRLDRWIQVRLLGCSDIMLVLVLSGPTSLDLPQLQDLS